MPAPPPESSSRLAVGAQPVNRRTHRPLAAAGEDAPETLQLRQQQLRARHELGRPLAAGPQPARARAPLPLAARVQAGVGVVSLSGALFVAQPLAMGVLVVVGAVSLTWAARGLWRAPRPVPGVPGELLPAAALASLDALLVRAAPELPEAARPVLQRINAALAQAQQPEVIAALSLQDRAFVLQTVVRYLPDSLEAFLRLPPSRRAVPLADGQPSADDALVQQLGAVDERLQRCLQAGHDEAAEALLRQQRFLDAKARE
jgi:hypothetical protein